MWGFDHYGQYLRMHGVCHFMLIADNCGISQRGRECVPGHKMAGGCGNCFRGTAAGRIQIEASTAKTQERCN